MSRGRPREKKVCAVLECACEIPHHAALCDAHFKALPHHLRLSILAAGRDKIPRLRARAEAVIWYADDANRAAANNRIQAAATPRAYWQEE